MSRDAFDYDRKFQLYIDGEWRDGSGEPFQCVDPATEKPWGTVQSAGPDDVDRAVRAARRAFDEDGWPQTLPGQRAAMLRRLGGLIEANMDVLVEQQVMENGRMICEMKPGTGSVARACHYYAGLAETLHGVTLPPPYPNLQCYSVREPMGVVAAITPWNAPLVLLGWKLLPALAAGNTMVIKPSEITPTSSLLLAELVEEAGFPKGVVNVITGYGDPTGAALINHPGIDKIAFTGSTATGRVIAKAAAERNVRTSLELGGKSPNILFADADLDKAVNGALVGIFSCMGQACMAGSRVLVEDGIYDEVAERMVEAVRKMSPGDPMDPATAFGPVSSQMQLDKVLGYFDIAEKENIKVLTGGKRVDRPGYYIEPTIFSEVDNSSRVAQEEIFGPVVCLIRFKGEDEAVRIANDTQFGLAAAVWTENVRLAHRMVSKIRAGTVWVNNYRLVSQGVPFGGYKQSGVGREMGPEALHEFTEVKSVWIDTGNRVEFRTG